jgi:acyl-CoA synthetase (NDP forming)
VTNAGFECVAFADSLGRFRLPELEPATVERLQALFDKIRIGGIVEPRNPLDLTPMTADAAYEEAIRLTLADGNVDVGVVGCVPLTGALNTLPAGAGHRENLADAGSIASRMARILVEESKAWVAVIDAGPRYDPLVAALESLGVPTFPAADRALRLFEIFCAAQLRS